MRRGWTRRAPRLILPPLLLLSSATSSRAQALPDLRVVRAVTPPKIDGSLDDAVWQQPAQPLDEWLSYNPIRGESSAPRTDVRVAYDDRYIYFAFECFDTDPSRIRTTISRRDTVGNDDWVGISLDSAGTGQTAYHLFVNPSGIQLDALNTQSSFESFDADFVWDSAGASTEHGYVVEIRLPLQTIRFKGGQNVRMGILYWRHISRTGKSYSWPSLPPGQWVFDRHAHLVFDELMPRRLMELLPSLTFPIDQTRAAPDRWNKVSGDTNFGVSGKFGITSNMALEATVHPDFSQVESDSFQVQENQRYPIFYSEKRPFFMEGMGLFNIAGAFGDANMRTAVHTRRIVEPRWGTKLLGTLGRTTVGFLSALDETPDTGGDSATGAKGARKLFAIARSTYALGGPNYVGGIATDTEQDGVANRSAGADFLWRYSRIAQISGMVLASQADQQSGGNRGGRAAAMNFNFNTRRVTANLIAQHYDESFQMDTAFYNRTGFTSATWYVDFNFFPNRFGIVHVFPILFGEYGYDEVQRGYERTTNVGVRFNFAKQSYLNVTYDSGYGPWHRRRYDTAGGFEVNGNVQLFRWLSINGSYLSGPQIFYDLANPFQGRATTGGFGVTLQPNAHINQDIQYNMVRFDRASSGARVFDVDILNTRTTYQFDKHFLVRLLERFDSSRHELLTDLLGSYELVPGTVAHAGYGSVFEKARFDNNVPTMDPAGQYVTAHRGLFFKVSYLHRF